MGDKSDYVKDGWLTWLKNGTLTGTPFNGSTPPTTHYVALFTTNPTADDGTGAVEVSGGSYARASITAATGYSSISGSGTNAHQISNSGTITFATPTADWGTVIGIGLYDASTSGNLLFWDSITSQVISTGVVASIGIGDLVITDD